MCRRAMRMHPPIQRRKAHPMLVTGCITRLCKMLQTRLRVCVVKSMTGVHSREHHYCAGDAAANCSTASATQCERGVQINVSED
jgi:hypothetical protein